MRALFCSAVLWALSVIAILPVSVSAQSQSADGGDIRRPQTGHQVIRPGLQDFLQPLLQELARPQHDDVAPPPRDDVVPPRGGDVVRPQGEVVVVDRAGPVIRVRQQEFASSRRAATVQATITDASGVGRAVVSNGGQNIRMTAIGGNVYQAEVPLAAHYRPVNVVIQAWDTRRNAAKPVPALVRRAPGCGRADGVSLRVVQAVQQRLAALGRYGGAIDGLAGPGTCGAIADAGIRAPFYWPDAIRELDRVIENLIALRVEPPAEIIAQMNVIRVSVVDPGNTGKVASVRMLVDGKVADVQPNGSGELGFMLAIAEGAQHRVTFQAMDARQTRPLAEETVTLTRPDALRLHLSGDELSGARIESDADLVTIIAEVTGAQSGRVYYGDSSGPVRDTRVFSGVPVRFPVKMPPPGERAVIVFGADSGNRSAPARRVELIHLWLTGPVVPALHPALAPAPLAGLPPRVVPAWSPVVPPAVTPLPPAASPRDRVPAPAEPAPPLPPPPLPWQVPVGLGAILVFGMIAGMVSLYRHGFRRHPVREPKFAPPVRVVAVPDPNPAVEVAGADLPGLMLTVDTGARGRAAVTFDEKDEEMEVLYQ